MPELPEVETYVRELAPQIRGRTVTGAAVTWPRIIAAPAADEFTGAMGDGIPCDGIAAGEIAAGGIVGDEFATFGRRGKYMLLGLASGRTLIVHLRMTGKLLVQPADAPVDPHTHVVMDLDDGRRLHYQDPRKFGRIWLAPDVEPVLRKLGPEPLSDAFNGDTLAGALQGRKASVKGLLLNQSIVAGVGNIYADEALFGAGIDPRRPGGSLNAEECAALCASTRAVLDAAIKARGSSLGGSNLQNYVRPGGEQGGFQMTHNVFRRTGEPCPACGTPIQRVVLTQRSTHFCPTCQR